MTSGAWTIALLWGAFAVTHMIPSSARLRPRLVGVVGERVFQGLYSVVSLAIFVPLVRVYFDHKHEGPALWVVPITREVRWAMYVGMAVAITLLVAGLVRPSPASIVPGDAAPHGVQWITRHPLLMAFAIFGMIHLIPNGHVSDVVFFGGFPVFVVLGCWHQDRRKRDSGSPTLRAFYDATPFVPFTGRETLRGLRELPLAVVALGLVITAVIRWHHGAWFGG